MNLETLNRWTAALRSGEYVQTKGVLYRRNDKPPTPPATNNFCYCCLGVLCELINPKGLHGSNIEVYTSDIIDIIDDPMFPKQLANRLSSMNDAGDSFSQIADYIDVNKHLFITDWK